jgi:hypothetical protein
MDSPYLEHGESIILTTDRVSINSAQYDVLLTTRYLILVDVRYAQFQPQKIPLLEILSVKGGKTAVGDQVITLYFSDTSLTGGSGQMNLIFSRYSGEQRDRERDEWLKKLMECIVAVRQETIGPKTNPAQDTGIRPATRRTIAPEMQLPHTTVINIRPEPVELSIIHNEPESPASPEEPAEPVSIPDVTFPEVTPPEEEPEITVTDTVSPDLPESSAVPAPREEPAEPVSIPDVTFPEVTPPEEEPEITVTDTVSPDLPESSAVPAPREEPAEPVSIPDVTPPEVTAPEEEPEITSLTYLSAPSEPAIIGLSAEKGEEAEQSEAIPAGRSEPGESATQPAADIPPGTPGTPPPPAIFWDLRKTVIIAIIILILGFAGGTVIYSEYFTSPETGIFPVPTPAITETTVPVPSAQLTSAPTQVVIPQTGVWVRVMYPLNFYGRLGNPGSLRGITGSGDRFYQMDEKNRLVQVQIYKTDNTGDRLTVEIYRNGEIIQSRSTTSPMGLIELLIDAETGQPPGIVTPKITQTAVQTASPVNNQTSTAGNQTVLHPGNQTSLVSNQSITDTSNQTGSENRVLYF